MTEERVLLIMCGTAVKAVHNIILSHLLKDEFTISKVVLLVSKSAHKDFAVDVIELVEKSSEQIEISNPVISYVQISDVVLDDIITDVENNLPEDKFILDVTGGRKIMAVGAAIAFQKSNAKSKSMSYYLLNTEFDRYYQDILIQDLFEDEWILTYY